MENKVFDESTGMTYTLSNNAPCYAIFINGHDDDLVCYGAEQQFSAIYKAIDFMRLKNQMYSYTIVSFGYTTPPSLAVQYYAYLTNNRVVVELDLNAQPEIGNLIYQPSTGKFAEAFFLCGFYAMDKDVAQHFAEHILSICRVHNL